ncbi:NAD(P)H-binding protein [Maricaulis sp.]|uniref:NAD(P)H-binding protein n=1 Tax=Maricaulis sp. TaxID=1486257 RepID=UPI0025BAF7A8|nr:NAD(P)H-binding protein [Maricaulis sp.]
MHHLSAPTDILVIGATGKTGRHIVNQLQAAHHPVRKGSRTAERPFSWQDRTGWPHALENVRAAYIAYAPDLAVPGASADIAAFVAAARQAGVQQLVLLSGRGETEAQACEDIVRRSGLRWTIIRASWFFQNFTEGAFQPMVGAGEIPLPVGQTPEPFIDARDIADIATAALTTRAHDGALYEVTGPQSLTFGALAGLISAQAGHTVTHIDIPHAEFLHGARQAGLPEDHIWLLDYLFSTVLDGRNIATTDGVERALGRKPRSFAEFAASLPGDAWTSKAAESETAK